MNYLCYVFNEGIKRFMYKLLVVPGIFSSERLGSSQHLEPLPAAFPAPPVVRVEESTAETHKIAVTDML